MMIIYVVVLCTGAIWRPSTQCRYVEGGLQQQLTLQQCRNIASTLNRNRIGRMHSPVGVSEWYQCDRVSVPTSR